MILYFNELSIITVATVLEAKNVFKTFFETCIMLHQVTNSETTNIFAQRKKNSNFIEIELYLVSLYNDYKLSNWIDDISGEYDDKSILTLFKRMIGNMFDPMTYPEYKFNSEPAIGLGATDIYDSLSISFNIETFKNCILKHVEKLHFEGDELNMQEIDIKNVANYDCIQTHLDFILSKFYNQDNNVIPTRQNPFPNKDILNKLYNNMNDFFTFIFNENENTNSRINKITKFASYIAKVNGYTFANEVSQKIQSISGFILLYEIIEIIFFLWILRPRLLNFVMKEVFIKENGHFSESSII